MYIEIFVLLVTSMLFGMLYDLSHILYNPFGVRPIDLPHIAVGGGIRRMARAFATGEYLPPAIHEMDDPKDVYYGTGQSGNQGIEAVLINEKDSSYFVEEPKDRLRSDRRGSMFAPLAKSFRR